ncbi:hypothetical protein I3760_05G091300 [Carya illinoinensis]|nr:hypothetical protein I3760_05G091300 [Carya illinoinensis]
MNQVRDAIPSAKRQLFPLAILQVFQLYSVKQVSIQESSKLRERERGRPMDYAKVLLGVVLVTALVATSTAQTKLKCSTEGATCPALIDYRSANNTNITAIQSLFQVKKFRNLLGANNFPTSTPSDKDVNATEKIRIPFTCLCANGTGVSDRKPVYTVQEGDFMDHIARDLFSGLVTFQQIADINGLPDAGKIYPGQELWIPLPCSCDEVNGTKVVHYGMVVDAGSSMEGIAEQYGTTQETLLTLNNMTDPSKLQAGQVLDIPLPASFFSPLLIIVKKNCKHNGGWDKKMKNLLARAHFVHAH